MREREREGERVLGIFFFAVASLVSQSGAVKRPMKVDRSRRRSDSEGSPLTPPARRPAAGRPTGLSKNLLFEKKGKWGAA